ncbi:MAG: polymer-forming cytoskeletal protein [Deltaproteobacteria bacterium]|nr:polymer-forming cytoskeletal protein [Deltaproteobacteria bacterium]
MGKRQIESSDVELFLGKNVSFEGKMTFDGMGRIEGRFDGEIFSSGVLIVGETAVVHAEIKAGTMIVDGEVKGKVSASVKLEIHSAGRLYGNIETPALVVEEGGIFDGTCSMKKEAEATVKRVTLLKEKGPGVLPG